MGNKKDTKRVTVSIKKSDYEFFSELIKEVRYWGEDEEKPCPLDSVDEYLDFALSRDREAEQSIKRQLAKWSSATKEVSDEEE